MQIRATCARDDCAAEILGNRRRAAPPGDLCGGAHNMDRVPVAPQIALAVPAVGKMPLESGSLLGFEPPFEVFGKKFDQFAAGH